MAGEDRDHGGRGQARGQAVDEERDDARTDVSHGPGPRARQSQPLSGISPWGCRHGSGPTTHRPLHVAHLCAGRHRPLGQWRASGTECLEPTLERRDLVLGEIPRQFVQIAREAAERDIALRPGSPRWRRSACPVPLSPPSSSPGRAAPGLGLAHPRRPTPRPVGRLPGGRHPVARYRRRSASCANRPGLGSAVAIPLRPAFPRPGCTWTSGRAD